MGSSIPPWGGAAPSVYSGRVTALKVLVAGVSLCALSALAAVQYALYEPAGDLCVAAAVIGAVCGLSAKFRKVMDRAERSVERFILWVKSNSLLGALLTVLLWWKGRIVAEGFGELGPVFATNVLWWLATGWLSYKVVQVLWAGPTPEAHGRHGDGEGDPARPHPPVQRPGFSAKPEIAMSERTQPLRGWPFDSRSGLTQLREFFAKVQHDEGLHEKLAKCDSATVVQIASESGYTFNVVDLRNAGVAAMGEMTQEQLEQIRGGAGMPRFYKLLGGHRSVWENLRSRDYLGGASAGP